MRYWDIEAFLIIFSYDIFLQFFAVRYVVFVRLQFSSYMWAVWGREMTSLQSFFPLQSSSESVSWLTWLVAAAVALQLCEYNWIRCLWSLQERWWGRMTQWWNPSPFLSICTPTHLLLSASRVPSLIFCPLADCDSPLRGNGEGTSHLKFVLLIYCRSVCRHDSAVLCMLNSQFTREHETDPHFMSVH